MIFSTFYIPFTLKLPLILISLHLNDSEIDYIEITFP